MSGGSGRNEHENVNLPPGLSSLIRNRLVRIAGLQYRLCSGRVSRYAVILKGRLGDAGDARY